MTEENDDKALEPLGKLNEQLQRDRERQRQHPDYKKLGPNYKALAVEWCQRDVWTVDECANLFAGTSPHRPSPIAGSEHDELNHEVMKLRNLIANCVGISLPLVGKRRSNKGAMQFEKGDIITWAESKAIDVPEALVRADNAALNKQKIWRYHTPLLNALQWVVEVYWEGNGDYSTVPRQQEMIEILMERFPLTENEALAIDRITRHPSEKRRKKIQHRKEGFFTNSDG